MKTFDMAECLNCGKKLKQTPGRRPRIYCSDNCKQQYWQRKQKEKKSKINYKTPGPEAYDSPKLDKFAMDEPNLFPVLKAKKPTKPLKQIKVPKIEEKPVERTQNDPQKNEKGWIVREIPKMPAGLTPLQQQLWKAEQKKSLKNDK